MGKWGNGKIDQAKRHLWKRKRKRHAFYSMVFDPAHLDSIYRWSRCPTYFFPLPLSLSFSLSLSLFSLWFSSSNRTESNSIFDNVTVHFLAMSKSIQSQLFGIIWIELKRIEMRWWEKEKKKIWKKNRKKKKYEGGNEKKKKQKQKKKTKRVTRVRVLVRSIFHRRPLCVPTGQSFLSQPKCWAPNWQWSIYKIFIFQVLLRPPLRSTILIRKRLGNLPLFLLNSRLIFVFPLSLSFLFPSFSLFPLLPHLLRLLLSFAPHFPFTAEAVFQSI